MQNGQFICPQQRFHCISLVKDNDYTMQNETVVPELSFFGSQDHCPLNILLQSRRGELSHVPAPVERERERENQPI